MKKFFLVFILFFALCNAINAQWFEQVSNTNKNLQSVSFINANTGIAVGDSGIVLKTINGGIDWLVQPSLSSYKLKSICLIDSSIGYIVGQYGRIFKTINGGNNWLSFQYSDTTYNFNSVYFINADTGFIAGTHGNYGIIMKTINGGIDWQPQSFPYGNATVLYAVHFGSSSNGAVVGYYYDGGTNSYPIILFTTNGGMNWSPNYPIGEPLQSIFYLNADTGYAVGWNDGTFPMIFKTTNGWNSYSQQYYLSNQSLSSVYFPACDTGYAVGGSGQIIKTTNGGINWNSQTSPTNLNLNAVFFIDTVGYAVGYSGVIIKTSNGGVNTKIENEIATTFNWYIYPNPANDIIYIENSSNQQATVEILNCLGLVIYQTPFYTSETSKRIDISGFVKGIYFIKVQNRTNISVQKFVKQ